MVEAKKISRRNAIKIGAAVAATTFLGNETVKAVTGEIQTPWATFYPYYEFHDTGIILDPNRIKKPWDYHIYEWRTDKGEDPVTSLTESLISQKRGKEENLQILASNEVKLAFGDIEAPKYTGGFNDIANKLRVFYEDKEVGWDPALHVQSSALFATRWKTKLAMMAFQKVVGIKDMINPGDSPSLARVLGIVRPSLIPLDIVTGYLFLNTMVGIGWRRLPNQSSDLPVGLDQNRLLARMVNRIQGILGNTRPNDMVAFHRNLVWAHKWLNLSENEGKKLGRQLNISYQAGAGHAGVEDLLTLGRPALEFMLQAYSSDIWRDVVERNETIENVSSLKLLKARLESDGGNPKDWEHKENYMDQPMKEIIEAKISK